MLALCLHWCELIMTTLSQLSPGQRAKVTTVHGGGAIRQRLLDIGILPTATVELQRVAPTGNPMWIKLGGAQISLRSTEASSVEVEIL